AGQGAGITDSDFTQAGAAVVSDPAVIFRQADIVLKVQIPAKRPDGLDEMTLLRQGLVLVGMLEPLTRPDRLAALAGTGAACFAMEAVPRISRAQSMDALSSMSTVAGYKAVLLAADRLKKMMPMMMTAAGTVHPAGAMIIGAGVAGLQAIATARRLGANVKAVDTRPAVKEQVESLGARFVHLEVAGHKAEATSGYARDLGEEFYRDEQETIAPHLKDCDIAITTALVPGRRAPILLTETMVQTMPPGAVIVDMAVAAGGNCVLSKADQAVEAHGVTILAPTNLPALVPVHASQLYARNLAAFIRELVKDGKVNIDMSNEVIRSMLVANEGKVLFAPVHEAQAKKDGSLS
ncbi:MAG: NAD(P) transhydrogenase subunit alpha, partial [Phycisphaerae bacterium]